MLRIGDKRCIAMPRGFGTPAHDMARRRHSSVIGGHLFERKMNAQMSRRPC
jgi:hypothetical protein